MHLARVPTGYMRKWREGHALGIAMLGAVNLKTVERQCDLEEKQEVSAASACSIKECVE